MREPEAILAARRAVPVLDALRGPGDDAAVLGPPQGNLVWAIDLVIEGRHFLRSFSSLEDAAYKAVARNASDLAAMGADPIGFLAGVAIPEASPEVLADIARGLGAASRAFDLPIAGGDLSRADQVMFSVSVLGSTPGRGLGRDGARPGDLVAVTGSLGAAAAGLALHRASTEGNTDAGAVLERHPHLAQRHRRGVARLDAGRRLRDVATACIDVSDGIPVDLGHIAEASGVAIVIDPGLVPLDDGVAEAAALLGIKSLALAFAGDDYELAFTTTDAAALGALGATRIGEAVTGAPSVRAPDGSRLQGGHDHLA